MIFICWREQQKLSTANKQISWLSIFTVTREIQPPPKLNMNKTNLYIMFIARAIF